MIVSVPLQLWALSSKPKPADIYNVLSDHYAGQRFVVVVDKENTTKRFDNLDPEALNNTNQLKLYVFENAGHEQAVVAVVLDNLGKGASGQAVQCLNLMLGLNEEKGLK
jgi:N-acetyl-gamma-glutamyl-phosphate reductase